MTKTRPSIEPFGPALLGALAVHLALVSAVWWWLSGHEHRPIHSTPASSTDVEPDRQLVWFSPARFLETLPKGAPDKVEPNPSPAVEDPAPEPAAEARYIMVSRQDLSTQPGSPEFTQQLVNDVVNSLPGQTRPGSGARALAKALDRIDTALYEAFMEVWSPPAGSNIAPSKRSARLDITVDRNLNLIEYDLVSPSGSSELDLSILDAAEQVRTRLPRMRGRVGSRDEKFPTQLPSSFAKERYDCRITFHIE